MEVVVHDVLSAVEESAQQAATAAKPPEHAANLNERIGNVHVRCKFTLWDIFHASKK
jgi:hypothetical protein